MFGVWGVVGGLYVHTLVKNLLIKFLIMLFLVAKGCKFDFCIWTRTSINGGLTIIINTAELTQQQHTTDKLI